MNYYVTILLITTMCVTMHAADKKNMKQKNASQKIRTLKQEVKTLKNSLKHAQDALKKTEAFHARWILDQAEQYRLRQESEEQARKRTRENDSQFWADFHNRVLRYDRDPNDDHDKSNKRQRIGL